MLDARLRPYIDRLLNDFGARLAKAGISANMVTWVAFGIGMAGAVAIAFDLPLLGLALILAGRVGDGLDGAVARATQRTDLGGYLDIVLDFAFYGAVPLAFAIRDPGHAVWAAALIASFLANGAAFLAFAVMAEKRGLATRAQGLKSLYYLMGIMEGAETIAFFVMFCLFPAYFPWLAGVMTALCVASAAARIATATRELG